MKIKDVMEQTGLTDRAIRHYIECGLLSPHSEDTYVGRKNYCFSREDVERLEMIKVFRQAGFGIEQIKRLLTERSSRAMVQERLAQLETEKRHSERLIEMLQKADINRDVSTEELAIICSSCPVKSVDPEEIYAPTPAPEKTQPQEEKPFTMKSSWWRKVYGETTVEIKDSVQGVIAKMRQQQRDMPLRDRRILATDTAENVGRRFRCSKQGKFEVRSELDTVGLRGKVYAQNGKTYIRFYEVYEPLWTVLWIALIIVLFPLVLAVCLYNLFTGNIPDIVFDFAWDFSLIRSVRSRQEVLCDLREDMLTQIEAIRRWDE